MPAPITKQRRGWIAPFVVLAVVTVLIGGFLVYWFVIRTSTIDVRGSVALHGSPDSEFSVSTPDKIGNTSCEGTGGYSDLAAGQTVTVTGSDGSTLGTGKLEAGMYIDGTGACLFSYEVHGVDDSYDSYGVTVSHRGTIQFSLSEMKNGPDLDIGGN